MIVEAGDIFFTRSNGWIGEQIRWATRDKSEVHGMVNHVGAFVQDKPFLEAQGVEALSRVERTHVARRHKKDRVAVFRATNLTDQQQAIILDYLYRHVGDRYGWWKIGFHLADRLFKTSWFSRRLRLDNRPICSYLVAKAYAEAGLSFGVEPGSADPDDIWDFCWANPDKYRLIRELRGIQCLLSPPNY